MASDPKPLRERVAECLRCGTSFAIWYGCKDGFPSSAVTHRETVEISEAVERLLSSPDFAVVERDRVLTPEHVEALAACTAFREKYLPASDGLYLDKYVWMRVWNAGTPAPAPKLPVWTCTQSCEDGPISVLRDGGDGRHFVTRYESNVTESEALAMMTALADSRDGAGKWRRA